MAKKKTSKRTVSKPRATSTATRKIRYAVVGLGHIVQVAVLPAFRSLKKTSELVALVSGDDRKLGKLARQYKVPVRGGYEELEALIRDNHIDAVYVGVPNSLHEEYTTRALAAGAHVLCEKPLAATADSARRMQARAAEAGRQLMTAYRLHFDPTYTAAMDAIRKGEIGDVRAFTSTFSFQIKDENIRLEGELGGGALLDIGIYCINAARSVFHEEPQMVFAAFQRPDGRFTEVEGGVTATLFFSKERTAQFTASFGMADRGWFEVVGSKGSVRMEPAYEYAMPLSFSIEGKRARKVRGKKFDQFAAEMDHFSNALLKGEPVSASGDEGIADLVIIDALKRSATSGMVERIPHPVASADYARPEDARAFPGHEEPEGMVGVEPASNS
jgi:glucose-fructose oxidoreductase